ncbi:hypothetical protein B0J11DRAFT_433685 [Dendryphion nanum]|uniref:Uncharacterized protein n=1 Tax=Dendryphion nanum TaxID=256645 RepID=A0A9P9ILT1_9PLEO|nr:hypothetical protein B0J11DRAFT_433685 [Dendryphion nanum]
MPGNFQQWFPQFAPYFSRVLRDNCSSEFQAYLEKPDPWPNYHINSVVSCILAHFDESGKAQLAVSSVLLGILPTILGMVGSNTTEIGLLALRRPIFAILLSLGAPVLSPTRSFEYRSPVEMLKTKPDGLPAFTKWQRRLCPIKYITTVVAIGNIVHVTWQLCEYSVCVFSASTWWLPALWAGISVIPHLLGAYAVTLRVRTMPHRTLRATFMSEFDFSKQQTNPKWDPIPESKRYLVFSWLASFITILHLVMGTVVLSSALFISPSDAVIVSIRLLCSAVTCRVLLMFELHVLKHSV